MLILFETSGEWPNDLEAIQRIKAAFPLNIASILKNDHRLSAVASTQHVDVLKVSIFFRNCFVSGRPPWPRSDDDRMLSLAAFV